MEVRNSPDIDADGTSNTKHSRRISTAGRNLERFSEIAARSARHHTEFSVLTRRKNSICDFRDSAITTAGNDEFRTLASRFTRQHCRIAAMFSEHRLKRAKV